MNYLCLLGTECSTSMSLPCSSTLPANRNTTQLRISYVLLPTHPQSRAPPKLNVSCIQQGSKQKCKALAHLPKVTQQLQKRGGNGNHKAKKLVFN